MEHPTHYQRIDRLSLLYDYHAFLDTESYLADQLFIKNKVKVHFREEYAQNNSPYRVIFCHVRKRDRRRFLAALNELPKKMLLLGYANYLETCYALWDNRNFCEKKGGIACDTIDPIGQAE